MVRRKYPSYNISGVLKQRKKITENNDVVDFMRTTPTGQEFEDFVELVASLLPNDIPFFAVQESCEYLHGEKLSDEAVDDLAWRLAGNVRRLRNGHPVLPWAGIAAPEWMPVQIVRTDFDVTRRGLPGGRFLLQFLAGQACPLSVEKFWTKKYCYVLAPRLGFSRTRGPHPFQDVSQLMNFRLLVQVHEGKQDLDFEEVAVPSAAKTWNQHYLRMRARTLKGFHCPRKLDPSKPCYRCPWGLDKCSAAVRPESLIKLPCEQCGFVKYHDPADTEMCVGCHQKNLRKDKDE